MLVKVSGSDILINVEEGACSVSTVINGGFRCGIRNVVMHMVKEFFKDPMTEVENALNSLGLSINDTLVFLTAVNPRLMLGGSRVTYGGLDVWVFATVGLSNPYVIVNGKVLAMVNPPHYSTINIAAITNASMSPQTALDAFRMVIESKVSTIRRIFGYDGTTSDAFALLYLNNGPHVDYGGPLTIIGETVAHAVYSALMNSILKSCHRGGGAVDCLKIPMHTG